MTQHTLVCKLGEDDNLPKGVSNATVIQFIDGYKRLGFGLGQTIDQLAQLGLMPSEVATDLAIVAAMVTAADTRVSRSTEAQDGWTREMVLHIPVSDPELWESAADDLVRLLNFLTGDRWDFSFRARPKKLNRLVLKSTNLPIVSANSICLFSGGLDSFIGAINLLAEGKRPMLVSHYWDGTTSTHQTYCADRLQKNYPNVVIHHLRIRLGFKKGLIDGVGAEDTLRGRSFAFFALAALAASAIGEKAVYVPENGLISLNVPLDPLRLGALSTRTTHPYYMARINDLFVKLGISAKLENPYRFKTKGEMVAECADLKFLRREAKHTMSCSSPTKHRWDLDESKRKPQHCGHCVPCIIRRAALTAGFGVDDTPYYLSDLRKKTLNSTKAEGIDIRSFQLAIERVTSDPGRARTDIHKPGPLIDHPNDFKEYEALYVRGMNEVDKIMKGVKTKAL